MKIGHAPCQTRKISRPQTPGTVSRQTAGGTSPSRIARIARKDGWKRQAVGHQGGDRTGARARAVPTFVHHITCLLQHGTPFLAPSTPSGQPSHGPSYHECPTTPRSRPCRGTEPRGPPETVNGRRGLSPVSSSSAMTHHPSTSPLGPFLTAHSVSSPLGQALLWEG